MEDLDESTRARVIRRYNTVTRRPTARDLRYRQVIFRSFARVYGDVLPEDKTASILDVGCGEGNLLAFLDHLGYENISGFDLSPENVRICHEQGFRFVERFDALKIERFQEKEFDLIFILDLLEHLPKEQTSSFLEHARERLSPGGKIVVQTPNMACVFGTFHRYNDLTHEYALTEKTAKDLLMSAGFRSVEIDIRPGWSAATPLGRIRERYLWVLHKLVYLAEDRERPRIPTKNLVILGRVP